MRIELYVLHRIAKFGKYLNKLRGVTNLRSYFLPPIYVNAGCVGEILLMPAARIEIRISAPVTGGEYDLATEGYDSGGDHWPRMHLAHIVWGGTASPSPQAAPAAQTSEAWSVTGIPPSISSPEQQERLLSTPLAKRVGGTPVEPV
jgi:hypothetical protein